jgi:hypothetical protein
MPKQETEGTYSSSELPGSRKLAAGISLTLVANLILLSISFTVRENTLYGGELCLTKGILQVRQQELNPQFCSTMQLFRI